MITPNGWRVSEVCGAKRSKFGRSPEGAEPDTRLLSAVHILIIRFYPSFVCYVLRREFEYFQQRGMNLLSSME